MLSGNDTANGSAGADDLKAFLGNDLLDGKQGADTLDGGDGNDTYVVDDAGDQILDSSGIDLVQSSVGWSLLGSALENLTLTGAANIDATGNSLNNLITGNTGHNLLDGAIGNDTMIGGLGNDNYVVDAAGDVVTETSAAIGEIDRVSASISYTLGANLESLVLLGEANLNGTGNALANELLGNAGNNRLDGLAGNDLLNGGAGADTLAGGLGNDSYVVDDLGDSVLENLNEGTERVFSSVDWTLGANLEHLTLNGVDDVSGTGNAFNNDLVGNDRSNLLDGAAGADTMTGGAGDDSYVVDQAGDVVNEGAEAGIDEVRAALNYTLGANLENLVLGGTANLNGIGNALANEITGNAGNNLLDGGGGPDTLAGGLGNDTYLVDSPFDVIDELPGQGTDLVVSSATVTLASDVENLQLTGSEAILGTGNDLDNRLTGNSGANFLIGQDGDDMLDGGAGGDVLIGGAGNDSYVVDSVFDAVNEILGEGYDSIFSSIASGLAPEVEALYLTGYANIDAEGNELANRVEGNEGDNRLHGGGGADTLAGGRGDDTYLLDDGLDTVIEGAGGGSDTVEVNYSVSLADFIENAVLTGGAALSATGNAAANRLTGNVAGNLLDGGTGNDTLVGADGDDTYVVADTADVIIELAGDGNDRVEASASYNLSASIETLLLTGALDIDGRGNAGANTLTGNAGRNRLDGGGGLDTLSGGDGNDTYVVDAASDLIIEAVDEGRDLVVSSATLTLVSNLEDLQLSGTRALDGTGNELDNRITGNSAANRLDGADGADTLAGGAGDDTYATDGSDLLLELNGQGTDVVESALGFTLGGNLEQLVLTGALDIDGHGNTLDNLLQGNAGANLLDGDGGRDTLAGGDGNDSYVVDGVEDVVIENFGEGIDTVISAVTRALGANQEYLVLTGSGNFNGSGNELANRIDGNGGNNQLQGGAGDDSLYGGGGNDLLAGGTGTDSLDGGAGNDSFQVDDAGDIVTDGSGNDTVFASASYLIATGIETLILTGGDLNGTGNADANLILGSYGANRLDGAGGADTLIGGAGNDTYVIDQAGDLIIENPYQGEDSVESSISYTLGTGLEHLSLTGGADLDASGNGADNRLTGNAGANRLAGGDGRDTLAGAGGDDTYFIDGDDVVSEDLTAGNDTIHFMVTRPDQVYQLGANLENLVLDGSLAGNGVGNALDNRLTGNAEGNVLVGLGGNDRLDGGAGADLLMGGAGSDTYVVDHGADRIKGETATGGTDVVFSSVSYILPNHVEELHLTGWAHVNATGNNQNNVLVGNGGRNVLTGGLGNDSFVFDSLGGQPDRIADFSLLHDQILFETDVFTGIAFGALDVSAFASGAHYTAAQDASDRLICDTWNGYLYYDADGLGGTAAIQVAVLDPGLALTLMPSSFAGF
jgi:Ca2+-binding RTX toxin-like protein